MSGNRLARRTEAAKERKKKLPKRPFLTKDWAKRKEMVIVRVNNRIAKVQKRKLERLTKLK